MSQNDSVNHFTKQISLHGNFRVSLDVVRRTGQGGEGTCYLGGEYILFFLEIIEYSLCNNEIYQEPYLLANRLELGIA